MAELLIPQQIAQLDRERLKAYRDNLAFYQGQQWPSPSRRRERRLVFNYARAFVEKVASVLLAGVAVLAEPWDDSPEAGERARRAEAVLRQVYDDNDLAQLDFDSEMDAAVLGDGCFKVTWDSRERRLRVSAPDVQGLFVWTAGDDLSRVWRVASRYSLSPEAVEMVHGLPLPARMGGRRQVPVVEVWTERRFELWLGEAQAEAKANPYGFIPFVIFPKIWNQYQPKGGMNR